MENRMTVRKSIVRVIALLITITMASGMTFAWAAGFAPTLKKVSKTRAITSTGYLDSQAVAFDTYTKKDGYSFARGTDGKKGCKVIHFTMDSKGKITQKNSLVYNAAQAGHANDATIYKQGKRKYLFLAISGGKEKYSKTYAGGKTKIGVIFLDEFNKKKAKVRGVKVRALEEVSLSNPISDCAFSGIAYAGKRNVDGVDRQVLVLKDGRTFYAAYVTISGNTVTLTIFDSARIDKPMIVLNGQSYEASTQGITYHNGYVYVVYSGEKYKATYLNMVLGRVSYNELFGTDYSDISTLETFSKRITKGDNKKLAKFMPEAVFFRTLNGKSNLYLSVNRGTTAKKGSDIDAVLRSTQTY